MTLTEIVIAVLLLALAGVALMLDPPKPRQRQPKVGECIVSAHEPRTSSWWEGGDTIWTIYEADTIFYCGKVK